jgi:hypothetical protein
VYRVEGQEETLNPNRLAVQELSVADNPLPVKRNTTDSNGAWPPHSPLGDHGVDIMISVKVTITDLGGQLQLQEPMESVDLSAYGSVQAWLSAPHRETLVE